MPNVLFGRRSALRVGVALATPGRSPAAYASADQATELPRAGDVLVIGRAPRPAALVNPAELPSGGPPVLAWAMEPNSRTIRNGSRSSRILLVRLNADDLSEAEIPLATLGVVAFSAICTHAGCSVSGWKAADRHFLCPCHGSVYDPAARGRVVAGPAPRPLPALPLRIDQDALIVAAGFIDRIGGSTGRTD
jgi:rieske iron-sulfur protein